jgi:hypothetical protein
VFWKPKMNPATLKTILNSAPLVIQGASKLIQLIREQSDNKTNENTNDTLTMESLKADIERLEARLAATDESNIEQIKLIEQLAKQNEALAASIGKGNDRLNQITFIAVFASLVAISTLALVLLR